MDANEYWQENKRFVTTVAVGLVVFLVGVTILDSYFDSDINAAKRSVATMRRNLGQPLYSGADKRVAEEENDALKSAVDILAAAVRFEPREEFRVDPGLGSPSNQYLRALARVREDVLPRANRANLTVDPGLGMPNLSPTRNEEIERYLEALDVIETTVRMAIDARVQRIDKVQIRLDPGLSTRRGLGRVERTQVRFTVSGTSLAVTRLLARTQRPVEGANGRVLPVYEAEMTRSRNKDDEVRLELTLVIPRLAGAEEEAG